MDRRIVIIGGGAAGGTAAQFARKTDRKAKVTIFEAGKYPQYSKCALPHLISKTLDNVIEFDEKWFERANIELFLETVVEKIDWNNKKIVARRGTETIEKKFDSLIIATGAEPVVPPIKGIKEGNSLVNGVFVLRTIDDAYAISSFLPKVKRAVIVGAGAIGLEMAEALHKFNVKITVIEMLPSILPGVLDKDMGDILQKKIPSDIEIFTNHKLIEVASNGSAVESVVIEDEEGNHQTVNADMVLISTGIKANVELARSLGCSIGEKGGIIIDKKCQTSVKNIYAVGDCTQYVDFVTGKPFLVGLGSMAVKQGIVAGINAAGGNAKLPEGFLQTRTTQLFGMEIAAVGPVLNQMPDKKPVTGKFTGSSLPDYFPGGREITVKVLVDPKDGTLIGAQAIGENAAQRINVFACAIMNRMSANDFVKMETAYAPPIAPTLDPISIACDVARMRYGRK